MKKCFKLFLSLVFMTMFISGCGKSDVEKLYDSFLKMPMGSKIEVVMDKWGKNIVVLNEKRVSYKLRWDYDLGSIQGFFLHDKLGSKSISKKVVFELAKEKGLLVPEEKLPERLPYTFERYDQVKEELGKEGLVYIHAYHPGSHSIVYIWFDKTGKAYTHRFNADVDGLTK